MNIVSRFGLWIEKHFPEKMTAEDVSSLIKEEHGIMRYRLDSLQDDFKKLKEEVSLMKTQSVVKSRISGSTERINPFAQRLQPVQPTPGGNGQ